MKCSKWGMGLAVLLTGCATVSKPPEVVEAPVSRAAQVQAQTQQLSQAPAEKQLKRKIAIGRFSNETNYGRTFQRDSNMDPLGKQAGDILSSRLIGTQKFVVFERPDINKIEQEQRLTGGDLIGVDTLIVGSVTEFGRSTGGESGFFSSTKLQKAHAKVELRLVDVRTGQAFFSASGAGEASTESGTIAGFGSRAAYDGSLNDKAIAAAISDVIGRLVTKIESRAWATDILKVEGRTVYISGGERQGLKAGDMLQVYAAGEQIKSAQTGAMVSLPSRPVAQLRIVSTFGDSDLNEGSQAQIVSGSVPANARGLFVGE